MQFSIHTLQIGQRNFLLQNHLVEADDEVRVQESTVKYTETKTTTNKLEIVQMFGVDSRCGIDL
jgi:hypothetical protein